MTSSSVKTMNSTTAPAAIEIWEIHSGVASLPVEVSLKSYDWQASLTE